MNKPLYHDKQITIDYHPTIVEDAHILKIKGREYVLDRMLADLGRSSVGDMEKKLSAYNGMILYPATFSGVSLEDIHKALSSAYVEHMKRVDKFMKRQKMH